MQNIPYVRTAADLERKYNLSALPTIEKNTKTNQEQILKTNTILEEFTAETIKNLENLQNQVDGNVTTYYYSGVPTLLNPPVSDWKEEEYNVHLGDLYYDKDTGYAYRFYLDTEPNVYGWVRITDSDITEALAIANTAQDTADAKRRVFVVEPRPPYDVGDIWFKEDKDLFRCKLGRQKGDNFNNSDWILATNYTDDTAANEAKAELSDYKVYVSTTYETQADFIKEKEALELKVSKVETVANDKNKVFTSEPTTPYLPGDVYIKETTIDGMKQNLIYVCQTGRESGDYNPNDFSLQPSYASQSDLKLTDNKIAGVVQSVETLEKEVTTIKETKGNNSLYIEDALESIVLEYGIDGKSEQDGTPTPDNPVEIKSVDGIRNLWKLPETKTLNGVTLTNNGDGTITLNGTATANADFYIEDSSSNYINGEKYYISSNINKSDVTLLIANYNGNTYVNTLINSNGTMPFTMNTTNDKVRLIVRALSGKTFNNTKLQILLEKSSIAHSYVPYGSWLKVQTTGKNLFDIISLNKSNMVTNGVTTTWNDDEIIVSGTPTTNWANITRSISEKLKIDTYTISIDKEQSFSVHIKGNHEDGTVFEYYIPKGSKYSTFTTKKKIKSYYFYIGNLTSGTTINGTFKIQFEKGTKTDYEPYKEKTALIDMNIYDKEGNITGHHELCSTKDGSVTDTINIDDIGNVTLTKRIVKLILDENTNFSLNTAGSTSTYKKFGVDNLLKNHETTSNYSLFSTHFKTGTNSVNCIRSGVGEYSESLVIYMPTEYDTIEKFKTFLSNNNVEVYYVLAEPYTVDLGQIDISLFENINHINLLDDIETNTKVKYLINNVMNGTYATKGELELTNEQFQTTITNEFNSLERQMTSITQTGGAIDLAIQSSKDYTDSKNESLDNRITNSENNYNDLNNKYNTLNGKITDMNFSFKTDGLTIGTSGSEINSKLDNKGLKIYSASTLIAIFNQNGSGFKKLIATESIQLQNLLIQKRVINTPKANNMEVISFFFNKSLIENLTDLESD